MHLAPFPLSLFSVAHFPYSPALEGQSTPSAYSSQAGGEVCRRQTAARKEKTFSAFPPTQSHMHQLLRGVYIQLSASQKGKMAQLSLG